jgi:PAS domain S-box-containing protein
MAGDDQTAPALRERLLEAEETLAAIRAGEVDAVVVEGPSGQQVYTLESPDQPFWIFVERMQEGALTVTGDGTIVYCNPFFADLIGHPVEQVRGRALADFLFPGHEERFRLLWGTVRHGPGHGECQLRNAAGVAIPVQLAFNPLPAEDIGMFGVVVTDLTDRERAKRLEADHRAAQEANAARDQFLAVVSHELRTPLNAVVGWAQMLQRRDDLPSDVAHGLTVIERNAWVQVQLIDDLLDVSRILAGKLRLDVKPVSLGSIIEAAIASLHPIAEAKQVEIAACLPDHPVRTRGDADRLQQVVWNLLSNAVKFSSNGGIVEVELGARDGFAEVRVVDHGIGIPVEYLPRLFELYQQIERSASVGSGGLGLGLAIVKQLTELHGGTVRADSRGEGRGAEFTVRFPLLAPIAAESESDQDRNPAVATIGGLRLLIVEDEQDSREMLVELLSGLGAEVRAVGMADEALSILENHPIDLLISDIGLPEVDGYELIRRIRAAGRSGRDLPAIAVTAFAGREDRRQALLAGYQMHVSKPIDYEELSAIVATLAGGSSGTS